MFLQRLELQGFKSFAAKTVLDFPARITAIVGPNGSGKSNVTDAIRWLLGEREAKNLRGGRADDLIFAGTAKRSRVGFAYASLSFDNASGFFPVEESEVVIARRIDREGVSQFSLNRSELRLKDVIDFFARARLGARGLSVIGQGESDLILRASPLERREMLEEALGLKEYLLKKHSALRELRSVSANLATAKVTLEELEPRLRTLRRQVSRWEARSSLEAELRTLEGAFFGERARSITARLSALEAERGRAERVLDGFRLSLSGLEVELARVEASAPMGRQALEEVRRRRRALIEKQMTESSAAPEPTPRPRVRSEKEVFGEIRGVAEAALASSHTDRLREALSRILALVGDHFAPVRETSGHGEDRSPEEARRSVELRASLDTLDEEERRLTAELETFNGAFRAALTAVETTRGEIVRAESAVHTLSFEEDEVRRSRLELARELEALGLGIEEVIVSPRPPEGGDALAIERRIYRLRGELASLGEIDETVLDEARSVSERHGFLTAQVADLEGALGDLTRVVRDLDRKIHRDFSEALARINAELARFMRLMFGGGSASLSLVGESVPQGVDGERVDISPEAEESAPDARQGIEVDVSLPEKRVKGLETLSGGERSLVSIAILFAVVSISPPPFLVLDEIDAALDERNARRFGELLAETSPETQFIVVTHNRATMEAADLLYGVTMGEDGSSKILSLKLS